MDDGPAALHTEGGARLQRTLAHAAARHHAAGAVPAPHTRVLECPDWESPQAWQFRTWSRHGGSHTTGDVTAPTPLAHAR